DPVHPARERARRRHRRAAAVESGPQCVAGHEESAALARSVLGYALRHLAQNLDRVAARTMTDLAAALAAHGIKLWRYAAGVSSKMPCPRAYRCGARDQRDPCLSVTIDGDGMGAKWHCHRASCGGWQDGVRVGSEPIYQRKRKSKAYRRPPEPTALSRPDQ